MSKTCHLLHHPPHPLFPSLHLRPPPQIHAVWLSSRCPGTALNFIIAFIGYVPAIHRNFLQVNNNLSRIEYKTFSSLKWWTKQIRISSPMMPSYLSVPAINFWTGSISTSSSTFTTQIRKTRSLSSSWGEKKIYFSTQINKSRGKSMISPKSFNTFDNFSSSKN